LRALVLILVIATFIAAGGDRARRVAAAFDWQGVVAPKNFRLDAWVSPPTYTLKPPVILPGIRPGEVQQAMPGAIAVPAGSVLVVRASGNVNLDVAVSGGLAPTNLNASPQLPPGAEERRFVIKESGAANVRGVVGHDIAWAFNAVPDRAPTIELTKDPEPQARGALQVTYKVDDDYGVVDAHAKFELKPPSTAAKEAPRPLYGPPDTALLLAQQRMRSGVSQTIKDFSDHPWAGADVTMTLVARDEAGNEGHSQPFELRLPQRMFVKPLAKALIEQRRVLALNADARDRVSIALDALTIAPERFIPESAVFLGLRAIYWNLAQAKSDDDLREVVARLWSMATQIEDGNVSDAELALRQAQEALREALERGASDEEIKRLTEQLRAALDKFLQALAEEIRKHPEMARRADPNGHYLRSQDLKNMIDRLEQMARSGSKDAAKQLLDQLQQMLENLQMARPGQGMDGDMDDDMMSMLDDLGKMLRDQQQLRDRTFKQGQDQRRQQRGQRGQQGDQGDQDKQMGDLRQNQQALRDQLKKLLEEMKRRGLNPGQQGDQGNDLDELGRAGDAMGEAEGALGEGNADSAVDAQGRAIESMRRGAQALAQALQQQGFAFGPGPGGQPGRGQQRANQETDPLGRPMRHNGRDYGDESVKVPGEIDVQRARRILEELRRRFADPMRPQLELDYIERLLKDY
ncbi:MAG: TIGR02302 family protein, partial [Xanthobacteraceae bacterium]